MRSALVYDWLVSCGGGEKVVQALMELYPSPLYTLVHNPRLFPEWSVQSSFIQNLPRSLKWYRNYFPLFPIAIEQFDLRGYELVLSISHAVAKGVLTHAHQLHLCYCFTPMRYAWDFYHPYMQGLSGIKRKAAGLFLHYLRNWDLSALGRVDHFAAISRYIAQRIQKVYGKPATVIYPPVATHLFQMKKKEPFYLTVSRLVPYKKIDLLVEAFSHLPDQKLLIIGEGPEEKKIKAKAGKNIEFLGYQSNEKVRSYLAEAKAFLFAAEEDFGIAPVEAQASGTPVIAFGKGGALETIQAGKTGIFFPEQTVPSLLEAIDAFEKSSFDPVAIKAHAELFNEERFKREFQQFVAQKLEEFHENYHSSRR